MSNNLRLEVLLKAVDQATRPLKSIQTASKTLSGDIRNTQKGLRDLNGQASKIDGFRKASAQLAVTGQALDKAKREAGELAVQFKNTTSPTRAQAQALEAAKRAASELQTKYNNLRTSVQRQRSELMQAGINTRTLSADERRLKTSISETTAQLNRQREALARVSAQQAKLSRVKERYKSGKELAGNMAAAGAAGVGIATAGTMAGVKLLMPGYDFAQKNSELQAVLGVDKQSPEMQALRKQARQLGDNTAASADDAASAQIIIAKGGGDAAAIAAMTPVTLNLSLANRKTMEENAQLLMGTKAAFQLSNDEAAHIGDVLSTTMNKTTADFQGLSDSLSYLAPVAKNAGVSLEQAAAITGTLHDNNIRGSMAGTGGAAVITRLQAPTGKAYDALKELGVKTSDSKGNTRPLFTILKEMQASFERNKLGTGQKAEYVKTIFGEEAMKSASVLMAAATSGKLDKLTATIKASDGKTEELVKVMQDNLGGDFKEFQSAYEAVGTDLYDQQDSSLRKLTQTATQYVLKLDNWIKDNKELAETIGIIAGGALALIGIIGGIGLVAWPVVMGINAIIAAAGVLGTVFTVAGSAIVTALGAITWPIVAVGAAIVAGALLIRKYWEPISAFFTGVIEGIMSAFAPVGEMFAPLAPIFDGLGEKLRGVWQWFKDLIAPVKATQETFDSCKNVGVIFGQALADALMLPLNIFNKLRGGLDVILEKLGLVKKESSSIDTETAKTPLVGQGGGYIPTTSSLGGYQAYQPVTAPAGRTYIDQSSPTYQINLPGGGAPGGQLGNQLQDALEKYERDKRAKARASMMHD
ncbi:phage tail tape measure protein [Salmonella enterica subsp. enterica serovar Braenderup]|uniref:Phage tail tape measure protein n=1 Tax=Salmonella enterica subsp. enterica serovar Albany TaxID=211968 RepID=A0A6D1SS50_SALET|nr:phage tail tape measure protein [Salmonella enterica]EBF7586165.1 phage tail tape measure protein [Salmonella enterica subsp. enterica serovar Mbandaka]EBG5219376.1 phage tail tape measure protein [Salmonella enterica subsp. enterica serovar Braenderup]EAT6000891.1 phage tail tape measure protein [Salmonella enterica]EBQ5873179.1 phage tail tape measure protein [Salmonella enterica subsp. enterica serovar Braenderup]EBV1469111.1 phage tail tape measure protein [Salmonella enterica subsp. en